MAQVLALEVNLRPAAAPGQVGAEVQGARPARELPLVVVVLPEEIGIVPIALEGVGQFVQDVLDGFGDELSAVGTEETVGSGHGHGEASFVVG
jgi:hypothetical protein